MFQSKKNIIAGRNPVMEALRQGTSIDKILLLRNAGGEIIRELDELARVQKIPVQRVPIEKLNSITNIQHQGVVAYKSSVAYFTLQEVIDFVNDKGEIPLFLMLDGVTDVRNIGAIARSAICCGVQAIIIPDKGVAALQEDAMKASAGALEKVHICRVPSLQKAIDELHLNGILVYASGMGKDKMVFDLDFTIPCCLILGSEEKGVQNSINKASDAQFSIPMKPGFDSLNVSVAAGIILYEALKQRLEK
jgi:23S rRNA (guanosine2251-2'-O)-methyltransferase